MKNDFISISRQTLIEIEAIQNFSKVNEYKFEELISKITVKNKRTKNLFSRKEIKK